jgi:thiol-disulfide isomerase/thioredoxin
MKINNNLKFKTMKKLLSLLTLSLVLGIGVIYAQNQRVVVLECFTSATCGPCASVNPTLDNLVNSNSDKLFAIKYHVNWPVAGDPMNLNNPSEVSARVSYYGVNSVPYSVADGSWLGYSGSVSQSLINQWAAVTPPVEMEMTYFYNAAQDTISVIVMGRATSAVNSENLRLHIAVIEETMTYTSAPCASSNGERTFHNVMKKMLPNAQGTGIPAMAVGDYFAVKYSWALANVMDVNELTAVAWLQDHSTKQVFQGCKSSASITPYYAKQAMISKLDHTKNTICSSRVNPDLYITNYGSETINSLNVNVTFNGTSVADLTWNGNIAFSETKKVNFGELDFSDQELLANNEVVFTITQINGAPDDYAPGTYNYTFTSAPQVVNKPLKLVIRTDDNPELITWEVTNTSTGEVVVNGGPYTDAHHQYTENFTLEDDGCYMFTIYDAGGNGMAGGNGLYGIKVGSQTIISGSAFTDKESNEFSFSKSTGIAESSVNTVNIYPNPSNGMITLDTEESGNVMVYNTAGQMVFTTGYDGKTVLNLSNLEKGTYLLVLTNTFGETGKQVVVLQ